MRKTPTCHPCAEQQFLRVLEVALAHPDAPRWNAAERRGVIDRTLPEIREEMAAMPPETSPAALSFLAIKTVNRLTGLADPYSELKRASNEEAVLWLPRIREWIRDSPDPLETAAKVAVAGNIIDLGIHKDYDIEASIRKILEEGFAIDHMDRMIEDLRSKEAAGESSEVFYICDNAGEIAFDRLFLETLVAHFPRTRFVAAVNGGPVLNDALLEDAEFVGLTEVVPVIDNGYDLLGTVLEEASPEFCRYFEQADWIVSKGQANYETLDGLSEKIVFLLKAKCEPIAKHVGVVLFQGVFKQSDNRLAPVPAHEVPAV